MLYLTYAVFGSAERHSTPPLAFGLCQTTSYLVSTAIFTILLSRQY